MGTGYFIRPSTSLPRIWGCNCVCFCCWFVLQANKEEPAGWSSFGRGSQGAIRSGRTRSRKGKRVKKAWGSSTSRTELNLKHDASSFLFRIPFWIQILKQHRQDPFPPDHATGLIITTWTFHLDAIRLPLLVNHLVGLFRQLLPRPAASPTQCYCPATPFFFHCTTTCQKRSVHNEFLRNYW